MSVEARASVITLGVADVARAKAFYEKALGWTPFFSMDDIAFFDLNGLVFGLFKHEAFRADMGRAGAFDAGAYRGFALAHNVRSEAQVDALFAAVSGAGAAILKAPHKTEWGGYSGYFADPDGNPWEVAFNPHWPIGADGRLEIEKGAP